MLEAPMYWISLATLLLVVYVAFCVRMLVKSQMAALIRAQPGQMKEGRNESEHEVPYGWFDHGWPIAKGDEDECEAIIQSCDPWHDKAVLKVAWTDTSEDCRSAGKERTGKYTKWVGVE
jgi:hypothetical protein